MFALQWQVHTEGYQWLEIAWDWLLPPAEQPETCWYLFPALGEEAPLSPMRWYHPLQDTTGLFRTFARTDPTREGIRAFANQYGLLGKKIERDVMLPWPPESDNRRPIKGERFENWVYELLLMRHVISLWDMTRKNDLDGLARHVHWYSQDRVSYQSTPGRPTQESPKVFNSDSELKWDTQGIPYLDIKRWIAAPWRRPELFDGLKAGDLIKPALFYIQEVVNTCLTELVSSRLVWDSEWKELLLRFIPSCLGGALWLQCAQAINGNKDYRQCQESQCKAWFELAPNVARSDKQFCSNACKTRAYRERQRHARQLHAKGTPLQAIVQQMGSDVETVKKWLQQDSQGTPP
jgi:hypothetical protein